MMLNHRSQDAVIVISQDNAKRDIIIRDLNPAAEAVLGYKLSEIKGQTLAFILPERIFKLLTEYVEYEPDGNDVGSVLSKIPTFCIVNKNRQEIAFRLKTSRTTPADGNDQFTLALQTSEINRRNEAFRSLLRENFKGHEVLDKYTGLPNRDSMIKDIEFVLFYVHKKELTASAAIIELDDFDQLKKIYDTQTIADIFTQIARLCKQNLRCDDTVGYLEPKRLGLILFDTASESARMVLNRLRWLIAAQPMKLENSESINVRVSIAFHCLTESNADRASFERIEAMMDAGNIENNTVEEVSFV